MTERMAQGVGRSDRYGGVEERAVVPEPDSMSPLDAETLPDPVFALRSDGTLVYANRMAAEVVGLRIEDFLGRSVLDLVHPDDVNLALSSFETVGNKEVGGLIHVRVRSGHGTWVGLELRGIRHHDEGGELTVLVARDTASRHLLDVDRGEVDVLRSVMTNMHGMVLLVDPDGAVRSVNGAVTRLLGHDPELIAGHDFAGYIHDDDREQVLDVIRRMPSYSSETVEARFGVASTDVHVACEITINNMLDDPVLRGYLISGQVATELADARTRVAFLREHDMKTGLFNRDGFIRAASDLIRAGGGLGLLVLDVVHFRSINELYGERTGDLLLTTIADRLDELRWPDLILSRLGGDEFV
ncbi:MAG: PAS domain-containing protein, partial [Actinomycetota bacterium]